VSDSNRRWLVRRRPEGWPEVDDFELVEAPIEAPGEGQVLLRNLYLSVDPYMRGRLRDRDSYAPPVGIGDVMVGSAVAEVVESRAAGLAAGDVVESPTFGWQEYAAVDAAGLRRVDPELAPVSTALGVLGMPGLTAYFGMLDVCELRPGTTAVVSGAAGAVGSTAGQIARIHGCRAVGVAGSDEKVDWLTGELGFDAAINYKTAGSLTRALAAVCPVGIDAYFDNVGGPITDAAIRLLALRGRVAICGQISIYNATEAQTGPRLLWELVARRARIEGFLIFDYRDRYREGLEKLGGWVRSGELRYRETVVDGIERTPEAFISMMRGGNIGKMLVKVG
jgi:hypothetical protein